jgi:23S rRNA (cytidine1920-2'-O)/16S rRNA (cytidine1409-2'-O)-methyltransferase
MAKKRLDELLVEKHLAESIDKAKKLIMSGVVIVDNHRIDKAGSIIKLPAEIRLKNQKVYVSRGGLKLEKAVKLFKINFENKIIIDVGASTGGFTDVALKFGAKKVYAVDVGKAQLHNNLVNNSKVIVLDKTNFKTIDYNKIGEKVDIIVSDVSFISLKLIIPSFIQFCKKDTEIIILIKPQFEAKKMEIETGGIVNNLSIHKRIIEDIISFAIKNNLDLNNLTTSPIKGTKGNIEYLAYFRYNPTENKNIDLKKIINAVVGK